jgi:hypothetical protein
MAELDFSAAVISDRLRAFTRALDSDTGPGELRIYTAPRPAPGASPDTAIRLCTVVLNKPSLDNVTGTVLTVDLPPDAMATATGDANWARFVNGGGVFVADADVGVIGSNKPVEIDNQALPPTLRLYSGGTFTLTLAQLSEA